MIRRLLILLGASLLLTACGTDGSALRRDHAYVVEWIGERPLIDNSHLTLTLGTDGRAYGNAGCNHWFANYTVDKERIDFVRPGSTRKMCAPALMEQEQRFLEALPHVVRWSIADNGQLQLWPEQGKPIRLWREE